MAVCIRLIIKSDAGGITSDAGDGDTVDDAGGDIAADVAGGDAAAASAQRILHLSCFRY